MRLIASCLAIAALAAGCSKDKPAEPSPKPVEPAAAATKPAEPTATAAGTAAGTAAAKPTACDDRHAVITSMFEVQRRVELLCDAGGRRVRFSDENITGDKAVERAMTDAEWDAAWKAIDAARWATLSDECGESGTGDDGPRYQEEEDIEITAGGKTKQFHCSGTEIPATHQTLAEALTAPAKPWIEAAEAAEAKAASDSPWQVGRAHVGPVHTGMWLSELKAIPDITIKDVDVEVEMDCETPSGSCSETISRYEISINGQHQLTLDHELKDHGRGGDLEEQITDIEVWGTVPRLPPVDKEWPAGVGTTAKELQALFGDPGELDFDGGSPWNPRGGACVGLSKQPVKFCFKSKAKTWKKLLEKNPPVMVVLVD